MSRNYYKNKPFCCRDDKAIHDYEKNKWKYHELSKESYLACFALLGAFVYFEEIENNGKEKGFKVISINVLCFQNEGTQFVLPFDGPYDVPPNIVEHLNNLNRFHVIPLSIYHEIGYVAKVQQNILTFLLKNTVFHMVLKCELFKSTMI